MRRLTPAMAVIGVGLAVGAPFVLGGRAVFDGLRNVGPQMFMILAGLSVISGVAKAGKLQMLLASLGHRLPFLRTLAITFATDFAFLSSPAGAAGYVVNVGLLRAAGTSWPVSTAVVGAEQALDLVFFVVAIPVASLFALAPLGQVVPNLPGYAYAVLIAVALLLALGAWFGRRHIVAALHGFVCALPGLQSSQRKIEEFFFELRAQISTLLKVTAEWSVALMLLTTIQWMIRYGVLWLVLLDLGHRVPFGFVLVLQAVVLHLAQWTGIPAGGGSADLGLAAGLGAQVSGPAMATALLLWRFSTLCMPLLVGALSLVALACKWRTNEIAATDT